MVKFLNGLKKLPSLPAGPRRLLLPAPASHWVYFSLAVLPVLFVLIYAINPWFVFSPDAITVILRTAMVIFIIGLAALPFAFLKFFYDTARHDDTASAHDKTFITLDLLWLISIFLLSLIIHLLSPQGL